MTVLVDIATAANRKIEKDEKHRKFLWKEYRQTLTRQRSGKHVADRLIQIAEELGIDLAVIELHALVLLEANRLEAEEATAKNYQRDYDCLEGEAVKICAEVDKIREQLSAKLRERDEAAQREAEAQESGRTRLMLARQFRQVFDPDADTTEVFCHVDGHGSTPLITAKLRELGLTN